MINYYRDGNDVVCYDEENKKIVKRIPIFEEDGKTYTAEFREVCKKIESENKTVDRAVENTSDEPSQFEELSGVEKIDDEDVEVIEPEETSLIPVQKGEVATIEQPTYRIVNEEPDKKGLSGKGKAILATVTMGAILGACIFALTRDGKKAENDGAIIPPSFEPTQEATITPEPTPSLEDLKEDSRYTEITEDILVGKTQQLIEEFKKNGIEINGEDALIFTAIANITHLEKTNPELLVTVLGSNADAEETLTKVGHIIGQVATLEVTTKDKKVDWTVALADETDKKIAQHGMQNVIAEAKKIAADSTLSEKVKTTKIQELIQTNYVKPNYDKTVGYDFTDGSHTSLSQEDGADFITDAIVTGILMGDNTLKNYIYGSETRDDLEAISYNEDNVSNIMRMIEECENVNVRYNGHTK